MKSRDIYYYEIFESPIGALTILCREDGICKVDFSGGIPSEAIRKRTSMVEKAIKELEEYFGGTRKEFTVPCIIEGTAFQKKVWNALREIPYGEVRTYKEIAVKAGNEKASRAVGMANHNNPIPIFVPCHRVIGANGKLTGYAGGLTTKEKLLELEAKYKDR